MKFSKMLQCNFLDFFVESYTQLKVIDFVSGETFRMKELLNQILIFP